MSNRLTTETLLFCHFYTQRLRSVPERGLMSLGERFHIYYGERYAELDVVVKTAARWPVNNSPQMPVSTHVLIVFRLVLYMTQGMYHSSCRRSINSVLKR